MDIELHLQVWHAIKEHILDVDKEPAADDFIKLLIEHGADASSFTDYTLDSDLKSSLSEYIDLDDDDIESDSDDEQYYEYND